MFLLLLIQQIFQFKLQILGITDIGGKIAGALQVVGSVLAVIILIVLGIKYMMGSPEEKAEYKKTMMPYVVGAVFIFAASQIAGVVYGLITSWN